MLFFLAIFAFVIVKNVSAAARKRQIGGPSGSTPTSSRRRATAPSRFGRPPSPRRPRSPRSSLPPPSTEPQAVSEDEPATGSVAPIDDQTEAAIEEVPPPPRPGDPVVITLSESEPAEATDPTPPIDSDPELALATVIDQVFGRDAPPHARATRFEVDYAGRRIEWAATVLRTSRGRRHREPATRAEVMLGYTSDRELLSDRVIAEVFLPPEVTVDRDHRIVLRGILVEANVYANRLVIDDATIMAG